VAPDSDGDGADDADDVDDAGDDDDDDDDDDHAYPSGPSEPMDAADAEEADAVDGDGGDGDGGDDGGGFVEVGALGEADVKGDGGKGGGLLVAAAEAAMTGPAVVAVGHAALDHLTAYPKSAPFQAPVDTDAFPDYLDHVATPMDLSTIRSKLDAGAYGASLHAFASDVRLVFANCMRYNQPASKIHQHAQDLAAEFAAALAKHAQNARFANPEEMDDNDN
jgi:hypothetical protein